MGDFFAQRGRLQLPRERISERLAERQESASAERLVTLSERKKGRSERDMESDRHPLPRGIEQRQRDRFRTVEARRRHHHGGRVEAATLDEIANRHVNGG